MTNEVDKCDPDAIRLIRSLSFNNCRSRSNQEIDIKTFDENHKKIYDATEKFIDKCIISPRGK